MSPFKTTDTTSCYNNDYNRNVDGYYMVEFKSSPYISQESKTIDKQAIYFCELVSNRRCLNPAIENSRWYVTPRISISKRLYH